MNSKDTSAKPQKRSDVLKKNDGYSGMEIEHEFTPGKKKMLTFNGRRFILDDKSGEVILLGVNAG